MALDRHREPATAGGQRRIEARLNRVCEPHSRTDAGGDAPTVREPMTRFALGVQAPRGMKESAVILRVR